MPDGTINMRQLALELGVNYKTFFHWQDKGLLPKPDQQFGQRRIYSASKKAEVIAMVRAMGIK